LNTANVRPCCLLSVLLVVTARTLGK